jgi:hypothetical protein
MPDLMLAVQLCSLPPRELAGGGAALPETTWLLLPVRNIK